MKEHYIANAQGMSRHVNSNLSFSSRYSLQILKNICPYSSDLVIKLDTVILKYHAV